MTRVLFGLWSVIVGLGVAAQFFFSVIMNAGKGIGVGEWAFLASLALVWIGGMVFFGFVMLSEKGQMSRWQRKTCPSCAEHVKRQAQVCRYCQHVF